MEEFILGSKTFANFTFAGCYDMPTDVFINCYEYFEKTGLNLLDDFSNMIYLTWDFNKHIKSGELYTDIKRLEKYENSQSRLRISRIFNIDWLADRRNEIRQLRLSYKKYFDRKSNEPRIKASVHTSNRNIRQKVFTIHGNKCLCCGATEHIQIDHIIPVSMGGKNAISNYQPLCKTCNLKKGIKIIDYRKEVKL